VQQWKRILVLSLVVFVTIGGAFTFAEEPADERIPPRARILEILQDHPEVLAEIQELWEESRSSAIRDDEPGLAGMMRARMMRHGQMLRERMAGRQRIGACGPLEGYGPMMGLRWNR
jgi:hypothetical protein